MCCKSLFMNCKTSNLSHYFLNYSFNYFNLFNLFYVFRRKVYHWKLWTAYDSLSSSESLEFFFTHLFNFFVVYRLHYWGHCEFTVLDILTWIVVLRLSGANTIIWQIKWVFVELIVLTAHPTSSHYFLNYFKTAIIPTQLMQVNASWKMLHLYNNLCLVGFL